MLFFYCSIKSSYTKILQNSVKNTRKGFLFQLQSTYFRIYRNRIAQHDVLGMLKQLFLGTSSIDWCTSLASSTITFFKFIQNYCFMLRFRYYVIRFGQYLLIIRFKEVCSYIKYDSIYMYREYWK